MRRRYKCLTDDYVSFIKERAYYEDEWDNDDRYTVSYYVAENPSHWQLIEDNNMEEIKISKERILEAASKCSTAKATLQVLFPEVFEENNTFFSESGIESLAKIVDGNDLNLILPKNWFKIPGGCSIDKAKSISKLIYNTWLK